MTSFSRIALAVVLTTLGATVPAAAQAAWTAPQAIVSETGASNVAGAGNRHGSEAFTWVVESKRTVRAAGQRGLASWVRARVRLPDGRLGAVQTISSTRGLVRSPQIGVDENSNVTAIWTQAGRHLSIMAAFRPHGKRFGAPVEIGRSRHFNDARPQLAVGRFGDAVVAWDQGSSVQVVRRGVAPCSGRRCFTAPIRLRKGADQTVAIGPLGSAYVVWAAEVRSGADVHTRLRMTALRRSGRRLGTEHFITTTGDASRPALAIAPDGNATIAWRASLPAGGEQDEAAVIMAATSSPDALTTTPQAVSAAPGDAPQLRLGSTGEAILAWDQFEATSANPDGLGVAVAIRPPGASAFGPQALVSPPGVAAGGASLAVDPAGAGYLLYGADGGAGGRLAVAHVRAPGAIFGAPMTLPVAFADGTLLAAGARITAISRLTTRTFVSDWTP